jgi:hypothetical protein
MSFEVFLNCFERGEPAGIPRATIRPLFPVLDDESEPDDWKVWYDEENWCNVHVTGLPTDPSLIQGLCVYRPCGDLRFWQALVEIMRLGPITLYFPGDAPPLVASKCAGEQLPTEMVDVMGQPRVVQSAHEVLEIIRCA